MAYFYYPPHNVYVEMELKEAALMSNVSNLIIDKTSFVV